MHLNVVCSKRVGKLTELVIGTQIYTRFCWYEFCCLVDKNTVFENTLCGHTNGSHLPFIFLIKGVQWCCCWWCWWWWWGLMVPKWKLSRHQNTYQECKVWRNVLIPFHTANDINIPMFLVQV